MAPIRVLGETCKVPSFLRSWPFTFIFNGTSAAHLKAWSLNWFYAIRKICSWWQAYWSFSRWRLTCCLVRLMAESPRRDGRKEALLFLSKWEVLRPGGTTAAAPEVLESLSEPHILEIIGDAIACDPSSGRPTGCWLEEGDPITQGSSQSWVGTALTTNGPK